MTYASFLQHKIHKHLCPLLSVPTAATCLPSMLDSFEQDHIGLQDLLRQSSACYSHVWQAS